MPKTVNIKIFGRSEVISCDDHEVEDLLEAAKLINDEIERTKEAIRQPVPFDRLMILSSLNLVYKLLLSERQCAEYSENIKSLAGLRDQIRSVLQADPPNTTKQ